MKIKEFKTLDEQIEILKDRGLVINDIDKATSLLLRENYFFINGYRHIFMKNHKDNSFINVEKQKNKLEQQILSIKDNKVKYSLLKLLESTGDMPYSYNNYGYKEDLDKISSDDISYSLFLILLIISLAPSRSKKQESPLPTSSYISIEKLRKCLLQ